jgi:nucleotide-binding universal stress UspA family protein
MTTIEHILVPTDFEEPAEAALTLALALAAKFDAKLTILHVGWEPASTYAAYAESLSWPMEDLEASARKELDAVVAAARKQLARVDSALVTGEPWQIILDTARVRTCDLIVMGTHGRRGLSRVFLGSVAERVVRFSPVPVLTLSSKAEREAREKAPPRRTPRT